MATEAIGAEDLSKGIGKKSVSGFVWSFSGLIANHVLNIISMAVLARKLTAYEFGIISAAMLFVEFTNIINNLGVAASLVQRDKITKEHEYTAFTFSILLGAVLYGMTVSVSWLVADFFNIPELGGVLRVLGLVFFITSFSTVPKALLNRSLKFKQTAANNTLSQLFGWTLFSIALALMGFGYWSIVGGRLANASFAAIGLMIRQPHSKKLGINKQALREILGFGAGVSFQNIIQYFAQQIDTIVVGRVMGGASLGIYNRAYSLMALLANFLSNSLTGILMSGTARIRQDIERVASNFDKLVRISAMIFLPLTTLVLVLAPEIIKIILGSNWTGAIILFQILAIGTFFRFGYRYGTAMAIAMGNIKDVNKRQLFYLFIVCIGVAIGINFGLTGVAIAVFVCLLLNYLASSFQLMNMINYSKWAFVKAHLLGVKISLLVFACSYSIAYLGRVHLQAPDFVTALGSFLFTGAVLAAIFFILPQFYGKQNIELLKGLKNNLGKGKGAKKNKKASKEEEPIADELVK